MRSIVLTALSTLISVAWTLAPATATAALPATEARITDLDALVQRGTETLLKHDFETALAIGRKAQLLAPGASRPLGIMVDALLELGRYEEAGETLEAMLLARPDLSSYSRLSYYHELNGRVDLAIEAMERALRAGGSTPTETEIVRVLLGDLWLLEGQPDRAAGLYRTALAAMPQNLKARSGLARAAAAEGDLHTAQAHLQEAIRITALPELITQLADIEALLDDAGSADTLYLVAAELERYHGAGSATAEPFGVLLETDHGDIGLALRRAYEGYEAAPSIGAADALAWALRANGQIAEAHALAREALRTGTQSPVILYHAGVISAEAGNAVDARALLEQGLHRSAAASPGLASQIREALVGLPTASRWSGRAAGAVSVQPR